MKKTNVSQLSAKELLPVRDPDGHKGSFGKVLLYAGSYDMAGAAILSATAVLRTGAGMVKLWSAEENRIILQCRIPESLLRSLPCSDRKKLRGDLQWADVIAAGCGIGKSSKAADTLRALLEYEEKDRRIPYVLDADALNLISERPELRNALKRLCERTDCILTPHAGELDRLFRSLRDPSASAAPTTIADGSADLAETAVLCAPVKNVLLQKAQAVSEYFRCIVVAKCSYTLVCSYDHEEVFENTDAGNSGMATAGSGDVLTGVIAGLLAQGLSPEDAAIRGVRLHALAGDRAASVRGEHGIIAGDLIEHLGL